MLKLLGLEKETNLFFILYIPLFFIIRYDRSTLIGEKKTLSEKV